VTSYFHSILKTEKKMEEKEKERFFPGTKGKKKTAIEQIASRILYSTERGEGEELTGGLSLRAAKGKREKGKHISTNNTVLY